MLKKLQWDALVSKCAFGFMFATPELSYTIQCINLDWWFHIYMFWPVFVCCLLRCCCCCCWCRRWWCSSRRREELGICHTNISISSGGLTIFFVIYKLSENEKDKDRDFQLITSNTANVQLECGLFNRIAVFDFDSGQYRIAFNANSTTRICIISSAHDLTTQHSAVNMIWLHFNFQTLTHRRKHSAV